MKGFIQTQLSLLILCWIFRKEKKKKEKNTGKFLARREQDDVVWSPLGASLPCTTTWNSFLSEMLRAFSPLLASLQAPVEATHLVTQAVGFA